MVDDPSGYRLGEPVFFDSISDLNKFINDALFGDGCVFCEVEEGDEQSSAGD